MVEINTNTFSHQLVRLVYWTAKLDILTIRFCLCDESQTTSHVLLIAGVDIVFHTNINGA